MAKVNAPACPGQYRPAFAGVPRYQPLKPLERLYKFVSIPIVRAWIMQSPWWIPETAFDQLRRQMFRDRDALNEIARRGYAIAPRWNPGMDGLHIITIGKSIDAWRGPTKAQPGYGGMLVGGFEQVCVPDLSWQHIAREVSQVPFFQTGAWT